MSEKDVIDDFVEALIKERALENLDKELLVEIKKDLRKSVENRINATILSKIPKDKLDAFEELLNMNSSPADIREFCVKVIPDFDAVIAESLLKFKDTYLNVKT